MKIRTHTCGQLSSNDVGESVVLNGWVNTVRLHGQVVFIDLRDHYGVTQCVIENTNKNFKILEKINERFFSRIKRNLL